MKKELDEETNKGAIEACVDWLMDNEFISIQKEGEEGSLNCIFNFFASMKYLKISLQYLNCVSLLSL